MTHFELNSALAAEFGKVPQRERIHDALMSVAAHGIIDIQKMPTKGRAAKIPLMRVNPFLYSKELGPYLSPEQIEERKRALKPLKVPIQREVKGPLYGPPKPKKIKQPSVPKVVEQVFETSEEELENPEVIQLEPTHEDDLAEKKLLLEFAIDIRAWLESDPRVTLDDVAEIYAALGIEYQSLLEIVQRLPEFFTFTNDRLTLTHFAKRHLVASIAR